MFIKCTLKKHFSSAISDLLEPVEGTNVETAGSGANADLLSAYRKDKVWNGEMMVRWQSEKKTASPKRLQIIREPMASDKTLKLCSEGTALLCKGDFHNANMILQALGRRIEHTTKRKTKLKTQVEMDGDQDAPELTMKELFHLGRQTKAIRARAMDMILIPIGSNHIIPLKRAPDLSKALTEVYGHVTEPYVASLREIVGIIGAYEWRRKGIKIKALEGPNMYARIHAHYGVFNPIRKATSPYSKLPDVFSSLISDIFHIFCSLNFFF